MIMRIYLALGALSILVCGLFSALNDEESPADTVQAVPVTPQAVSIALAEISIDPRHGAAGDSLAQAGIRPTGLTAQPHAALRVYVNGRIQPGRPQPYLVIAPYPEPESWPDTAQVLALTPGPNQLKIGRHGGQVFLAYGAENPPFQSDKLEFIFSEGFDRPAHVAMRKDENKADKQALSRKAARGPGGLQGAV